MNLKDASISLVAEQNATVDATASILAKDAILTALGNATINGSIVSKFAQLYAGQTLAVNGSITADNIYAFGNVGTIGGMFTGRNINLQIGGNLTLTSAGTLSSSDKLTVIAGGTITLDGATAALEDATSSSKTYTLTAGTDININGVLTSSDKLIATGRTANITNTVNGKTVTFTMREGFNLTG